MGNHFARSKMLKFKLHTERYMGQSIEEWTE